jgi:type I restriction-modification system DNA methylase subunit
MEDEEQVFEVTPVATKKGMTIFHCHSFPTRKEMAQIDREISRRALERMIIFTESGSQMWRWPEPRKAGGTRYVNHEFTNGNPSESLVQRLAAIAFSFEEEKSLNILKVLERVRASFNSDEVTNKFYKEFEDNQKTLADEIKGIKTPEDRSWYSSLLLNRLMFIYFMQRKGFLNDDPHYLRSSLIAVRDLKGRNKFYHFYKDFLLPLFHDGLGSENPVEVDPDMARIIGDVPYVNGGIFTEKIKEIKFNRKMRVALINAANYDWSTINPTIFGALFQSIKSKEERAALGEHYTSEQNINKIIYPLFLDSLQQRLSDSWDNKKSLKDLRKDLGKIKVFDPACGCGNFLVVAYRHLRQLELELTARLQELDGKAEDLGLDGTFGLAIGLHQFFGIEILEWPSQVARVALFITDQQEKIKIEKGQKVAQAVVCPILTSNWIDIKELESVENKDRGSNGFGSTGI